MPAKGGPRKRPMTDSYQSRRKWLEPKSLRVNRAWNLALTPRSDRLKANSSGLWPPAKYSKVDQVDYQASTTTARAACGRPHLWGRCSPRRFLTLEGCKWGPPKVDPRNNYCPSCDEY